MNDWQHLVVEELKAINRKMERIEDNLDGDLKRLEKKVQDLESKLSKEIQPIKSHIVKVRVVASIITFGLSALFGKFFKLF